MSEVEVEKPKKMLGRIGGGAEFEADGPTPRLAFQRPADDQAVLVDTVGKRQAVLYRYHRHSTSPFGSSTTNRPSMRSRRNRTSSTSISSSVISSRPSGLRARTATNSAPP